MEQQDEVSTQPERQDAISQGTTDAGIKASFMATNTVLLAIAIIIPVVSWVYIPFGGDSHWFARSGTIVAIIGIVLESRLFISKVVMAEMGQIPGVSRSYRLVMSKVTAIMSHFVLISGAIISGYGDLIFQKIKLDM